MKLQVVLEQLSTGVSLMKHHMVKYLWLQDPQVYYIAFNVVSSAFTSSELSQIPGTNINHEVTHVCLK